MGRLGGNFMGGHIQSGDYVMRGLRSILVATDFSNDARHAAKRTAMICAATGVSRAVALHVIESTWLNSLKDSLNVPTQVDRSMEVDALRSLEELVVAARIQSGYLLDPKMCVGTVVDTILEAVEGFDLLVLGARGKHSPRNLSVGTTVERLVRQVQNPVLMVRRDAATAYRRVLVAVDLSTHSHTALTYAREAAPGAEIYLVHVFEAPFESEKLSMGVSESNIREYQTKFRGEAEEEMGRFIEGSGMDAQGLHVSIEHGGHVPTMLRDKAVEIGADLVVVGKHGKSLLERLLMGSVTLRLLTECPCDVLVTQ
jgi:nucleotide-binding universal stress UspA family protein